MFYFYLLGTFVLIVLLFQFLYLYYKSTKSLHIIQQSGYDNKRMIRYIFKNYKFTLGINEFLPIIGIALYLLDYRLIGLFITIYFIYYNIRFYNMHKFIIVEKKPLVYTLRVKRLVVVLIILFAICGLLSIYIFNYRFIFLFIALFTYLLFFILLIVNLINKPNELRIKNGYKKNAKKKLSDHNDLLVIGITGSYGKTSIKNIINDVLENHEPTLSTPESFNTPMGLTITINNHLNVFHKNFIAEMGAYYEGEIDELVKLVNPKIGIVSSVGPQHLETFKNIETIQKTKMELIEGLPVDGLGILNYDNKYIREYKIKNDVKCIYYSIENEDADIYAKNIQISPGKTTFTIVYKNKEYEIVTKLLGKHAIYNLMAAILVGIFKGIEIDEIAKSITKIKPVSHRLEYKYISQDLSIIDDAFNANVEGIKEGIKVLGSFEDKRKILITPGLIDLGEKDKDIHYEIGKYLVDYVDDVILIGNYNSDKILNGIKDTKFNLDNVSKYDNFIDGYNYSEKLKGEKIILIANDLPDKYL